MVDLIGKIQIKNLLMAILAAKNKDLKFNKIIIVSNNIKVKDYITINDCMDGQLGPLVGVLSAMKWIKKNKTNL